MEAVKKIDIHAHAVAHPQFVPAYTESGLHFLGAEDLLKMYEGVGVERAVLLPIVSPEHRPTVMSTEGCAAICEQYPDRFVWFCNVDPRMGSGCANLPRLIDHYKRLGARGFGELTVPMYADDARLERLYDCLEDADLPLIIHISAPNSGRYGIMDELGLPRLEGVLRRHPRLKILGHSQIFWSEISADNTDELRGGYPTGRVTPGRIVDLLRSYDNLYCDLSAGSGTNAMTRDPEFTVGFLNEFSDRVLFGCDICNNKNAHQYQLCALLDGMREDGSISDATYRRIVRENAMAILKL